MAKVLMLGWEFPPMFSGGLGVATFGIVKALSSKITVTLILPTAGNAANPDDFNLIGLDRINHDGIFRNENGTKLHVPVYQVPVALSPYHHVNSKIRKDEVGNRHSFDGQIAGTEEKIANVFSSGEIYGSDILFKVHLFSTLAERISMRCDFDVIHAHDWVTFPAALAIRRRSNKAVILHIHALETDRSGANARNEIYWLEKNAMNLADRIIAVSAYTKNQIIQHYGIDPERISVIHNGIDLKPVTRKPSAIRDKLVLFLGRITHQKGPFLLLETAEKVLRVYPRAKFVVAGTGDLFHDVMHSAAYRKIGAKFIFTGFLDKKKVNELLAMADVYFMPSVSEPFGLSALEAAQYHVPAVLSAQSGVAEIIKSSLQADYWDSDKMANYIHALLRYQGLHTELADRAAGEANASSWDVAANKLISIYNELI